MTWRVRSKFSIRLIKPSIYSLAFTCALGILSSISVEAQLAFPTLDAQTDEAIGASDLIVQGSFLSDKLLSRSDDGISIGGIKVAGTQFVIPFAVKNTIKGSPAKIINVSLFYPTDRTLRGRYLVPLKETLVLFLKQEPGDSSFHLVTPWDSWLPADGDWNGTSEPSTPDKLISKTINAFLSFYLSHSNTKFEYPYLPGDPKEGSLTFENSDPSIVRALKVGSNLESTDPQFLQIVQSCVKAPGEIGLTAQEIVASSGNLQSILQKLKDYEAGKLQGVDALNLPPELSMMIVKSRNLTAMEPLISQALQSSDSRVRLYVTRALTQDQSKDDRLYPLLAKLLNDPVQDIQYQAMACMFYMSGEIKKKHGMRSIDLPARILFNKNPEQYLQQYRVWWNVHQPTIKP